MSTLTQLRAQVRTQLDLDSEDLPDSTVDSYLKEGFFRTFAAENRWPFLQHTWSLTFADGDVSVTLPTSPEVGAFVRLRTSDGYKVGHLAHHLAEDVYATEPTASTPDFFSVWGDTLYLWPEPSQGDTLTLRGYRKPSWTGVAGDELDGDERLHEAIAHYATALVYASALLEDPDMERVYMQRWSQLLAAYKRDLMRPITDEPLILNGGLSLPSRSTSVNLVV